MLSLQEEVLFAALEGSILVLESPIDINVCCTEVQERNQIGIT